jgi:hypothetical protein
MKLKPDDVSISNITIEYDNITVLAQCILLYYTMTMQSSSDEMMEILAVCYASDHKNMRVNQSAKSDWPASDRPEDDLHHPPHSDASPIPIPSLMLSRLAPPIRI